MPRIRGFTNSKDLSIEPEVPSKNFLKVRHQKRWPIDIIHSGTLRPQKILQPNGV
jgi:hypothetical protein